MNLAANLTLGEPAPVNDSTHRGSGMNIATSPTRVEPAVNECCPPATRDTCCETLAKPLCCGAVGNGCGCR